MRHIYAALVGSCLAACSSTTPRLHEAIADCRTNGGEGWTPIQKPAADVPLKRIAAIPVSSPGAKDGRVVWLQHSDGRLLYCRTDGCSGVSVQLLRTQGGEWSVSSPSEWLCVN